MSYHEPRPLADHCYDGVSHEELLAESMLTRGELLDESSRISEEMTRLGRKDLRLSWLIQCLIREGKW